MKFIIRTPNIKKSIKARTTGRTKRMIKKTVNPLHGKKGMGYINNPQKAIYNKAYNKISFSVFDVFKKSNSALYNIFIAFPLFLIVVAFQIIYYCYKYLFLGIVWIIKKAINLLKNKSNDNTFDE